MRSVLRILGFIADALVKALVAILWTLRAILPGSATVDHAALHDRVRDYETLRTMERDRKKKEEQRRRDLTR
jgi:hypothetical protein